MDTQNSNNFSSQPNRPMLKKVKRPINRIRPQGPAVSQPSQTQNYAPSQSGQSNDFENVITNNISESSTQPSTTSSNPFVQQSAQNFSDDVFNLDNFLDTEENLPSVNKTPANFSEHPQFIEKEEYFDEDNPSLSIAPLPEYLTKKILILIGIVLFFLGFVSAKIISSEQKIVRNGLQGVVINPEVPRGRARCGVAERTQGCVLYLMNPQRQELNARDFYDLASQLTGRQRFVIETGNMRYSNTKIRPGDIVQLNIPPL